MSLDGMFSVKLTPYKRHRSPELKIHELHRGDCEETNAENLRTHKRYLSEAMATDLSRLNMAFGNEQSGSSRSDESAPLDARPDSSSGCNSPSRMDCFNPFVGPRRRPHELLRDHIPTSPPGVRAVPTTPPGSPGGSACATPGGRGRFGRVAAALDWAAERLPPSPNDPPLGMDLRKTALLRSLMLRTDDKLAATPGPTARCRPRMVEHLPLGAAAGVGARPRQPLRSPRPRMAGLGSPNASMGSAIEMDISTSGSEEDDVSQAWLDAHRQSDCGTAEADVRASRAGAAGARAEPPGTGEQGSISMFLQDPQTPPFLQLNPLKC